MANSKQGREGRNVTAGGYSYKATPGSSAVWEFGKDLDKKDLGLIREDPRIALGGQPIEYNNSKFMTDKVNADIASGKRNENSWIEYYTKQSSKGWNDRGFRKAYGQDVYATQVSRVKEKVAEGKAPFLKKQREGLQITREGKSDLVEDTNKPLEVTAEDILKRRLAMIRMKGRASMPLANAGEGDEPTINISSGGTMGLNFA